jgi:glycosyltransferase involved in cell wall biosynthesis
MIKTSFIVIAYNEEHTIGRCLDSILAQDNLADYEIIVVDDGSRDATAKIVEEFAEKNSRVVLHRQVPNQGRGAARATGVSSAQGEYIAFVDADIVLPAHWLTTCLGYMPKYDAVGGIAVPDGDVNYLYTLLDLKPKIANPTTIVAGSNGFYKRKIFEEISFDKELRDGEDSVFNKVMVEKGFKIISIKTLIVEHKEARRLSEALKWLYQIGKGATRQFKQFKEMRLPDIAYFLLVGILLISAVLSILLKSLFLFLFPIIFILLVDIVHIRKKFFFEPSRTVRYVAGILVYWSLIASYFLGRTAGWFVRTPKTQQKKKVMICFDFEGKFGMPFQETYDLVETTRRLLKVLGTYNVKAVFFVVGKIIEENPDLIKEISKQGHEIGMHGYAHEHLDNLNAQELLIFSENLFRVEKLLEKLIGKRVRGFRAPYLIAPKFYIPEVYQMLEAHGYLWVSNREIRYPDELFRPDRIGIIGLWGLDNWFMHILLVFLNLRMIFSDSITGKKGISRIIANVKWLSSGTAPFRRGSMLEVPVYSPLDCDLLGLPKPNENTPKNVIRYAVRILIRGIKRRGELHVITFHDWIVGNSNRIQILELVLRKFTQNINITFQTSLEKSDE